jgi:hypothetical protein
MQKIRFCSGFFYNALLSRSDLDLLAQSSDKTMREYTGMAGFVEKFDQLLL